MDVKWGATGDRVKTQPASPPPLGFWGGAAAALSGRSAFPARLATAYRGLFPAGHARQMEL